MQANDQILRTVDWDMAAQAIDARGYAIVPEVLTAAQCQQLTALYEREDLYRKTVSMERYRFGRGEYKYFRYPLPDLIDTLRHTLYPPLAHIANGWVSKLGLERHYPDDLRGLLDWCRTRGQAQPTPLILKYGPGGYNTLHQDLYGDAYFPLQIAFVLSEPETEFTGGAFVMTEQVPRAQSRPIVVNPGRGDMLVFTTNFRPVKGARGYYRATMKHGVSELLSGQRFTLGVIFHDAAA